MLRVSIRQAEDTTTLWCRGRIVAGHEVEMLETVAAAQRCRRLRVDLWNVDAIDARGVAALVAMAARSARGGPQLAIVNPSSRVEHVLRLVRLDTQIELRQEPAEQRARHWALLDARPDAVVELEVGA